MVKYLVKILPVQPEAILMKSKMINVDVICPLISGKYDFAVDIKMTAGDAAEKIAEQVRKYEKADFLFRDGEKFLYAAGIKNPLNPSSALEEYGIVSGTRLMLV